MKKLLYILTLSLLFTILNLFGDVYTAEVSAADKTLIKFTINQKNYNVNGSQFKMDVTPFIENNRVYVPVRFLANSLGIHGDDIEWDAEKQTVILQGDGIVIKLAIDNKTIYTNEQPRSMDVSPLNKEGRVFLPARWVAVALGYEVKWDSTVQQVLIGQAGELTVKEAPNAHVDKIRAEFDKADRAKEAAWSAMIDRADYQFARQNINNFHRHINNAFRYYRETEPALTATGRKHWQIIFEIYRLDYDLSTSTVDWFIAGKEIEHLADERVLTNYELFIKRTTMLSEKWANATRKIDGIAKTTPAVFEITLQRDVDVETVADFYWEMATLLEESAAEGWVLIAELKAALPDYLSVDERLFLDQEKIVKVSEGIIPLDLAHFFDGFDIDKNGEIDLGEAHDFFYWVEDNIKYRWDDEKDADAEPGDLIGDNRPGVEYWQTPHETWLERAGDCEDTAILQVAFYNYFGISAYIASVNTETKVVDHAIAIVRISSTPVEFVEFLGDLVYYEVKGNYYMLVDNAYSSAFGYLCGGLAEGQFTLHEINTLEEAVRMESF